MHILEFVWDKRKELANRQKHGVGFDEAAEVFADEYARIILDPEHSDQEDLFILLGMSARLRVLVVCHCYRAGDAKIRIISARKAHKQEAKDYGRYLK